MSAPNNPPPFGGQGQARPPKFQKNDVVHVIGPTISSTTASAASTFKTASKASKTTPSKTPPMTASERIQQQRQTLAAPSAEFIPHTIWRIDSCTYSDSGKEEHVYELVPHNVCHISVPEFRLIAKCFLIDDVVKKDGTMYKVEEVKLIKECAKVVLKYIVKDEFGTESVLDDMEVEKGDERQWAEFGG